MASSSKTKPAARSGKSSGAKSPESFQSLHQRNVAAEILQSYEKLSWYSMQRCEASLFHGARSLPSILHHVSTLVLLRASNYAQSLTQTRLHFQNIVAGFTDDDEAAQVDWREDLTPRGDAVKREKGKERESLGESRAGGGSAVASGSGSARKKRRSDGRVVS